MEFSTQNLFEFSGGLQDVLIYIRGLIKDKIIFEQIDDELQSLINSQVELYEHYPDGTLKSSKRYKGGQLHGICREYHSNGNLKLKTGFCRGQENGFRKECKANGETKSSGHMFLGKKQGKWITNSKFGEEIRFYDEGQPVLHWKTYSKHGRVMCESYGEPSNDYEKKVFKGEDSLKNF